jgi:hypothetical protein
MAQMEQMDLQVQMVLTEQVVLMELMDLQEQMVLVVYLV